MSKFWFAVLATVFLFSCSDYDEVEYTVLLPNAGEDFIFFTEESGTIINLDGSASSDVNELGFNYFWEIVQYPEGSQPLLSGETSANPRISVDETFSGRISVAMIIARDDQRARDFVNVDVNPKLAEILFVNAIDGGQVAALSIPSIRFTGNDVAPLSPDNSY